MSKRLVEIDDALLERARATSGATTIRATVDAGLRRLVDDDVTEEHVAWLRSGQGLDLDALAEARAPGSRRMAEPRFLVDTSVLARAPQAEVGQRLEHLLLNGRLWTCRLTDLELAYADAARDVTLVCGSRRALPRRRSRPR